MNEPRLYILMRTDMDSMNPGKAMAQAAHAANAFTDGMDRVVRVDGPEVSHKCEKYTEWKKQTDQGFGTTIVLGVNVTQLYKSIEESRLYGFVANIVHDPSYPVRDGEVVHLLPVDTCGYVFAPDGEARPLQHYNLHP